MKKFFIPLIAVCLLTACEEVFQKTIDYEIPREPSKLVIESRLLAGDSVHAFINTSEYSMGTASPKVDSQNVVKLYENGILVGELQPSPEYWREGHYEMPYEIKSGNTYRLEASRHGYETAFGENPVRDSVVITKAELKETGEDFRLTLTFNDPVGRGDYYYFTMNVEHNGSSYDYIYYHTIDPTVEVFEFYDDPFSQEGGTSGYEGYISDQYFDGSTKNLELTIQIPISGNIPDPESLRLVFDLYRISEDYYLHEKSKAAQNQSEGGLFAEPVQVYTNVVNGYGVVTGATLSRIKIKP